MTPAKHDLTIYRDRDFSQVFYFKSHGVIMDLTGYSGKAQMRHSKDADAELIVSFDVQIVAGSGSVTISLEHSQTIALMYESGFWDLVLTNADGARENYIEGMVAILKTVTRDFDDAGGVEVS